MAIGVTISIAISDVDPNTDIAPVDILAVALYGPRSVFFIASSLIHPQHHINRHWATAFCTVEGNEPSLTALLTVDVQIALVNNTESGVIFGFFEKTILYKKKQTKNNKILESVCGHLVKPVNQHKCENIF